MIATQLYLASKSPRRKEILNSMGLHFEIIDQDVPELRQQDEDIDSFVRRLAREKAMAGLRSSKRQSPLPVLGADTIVVLGDTVFGKPQDRDTAREMLLALSNNVHHVLTAVALCDDHGCETIVSKTYVHFRVIKPNELEAYLNTHEPYDKAGAYGIQGLGGIFVSHIEGSYTGVMGLPMAETAQLLSLYGIQLLNSI